MTDVLIVQQFEILIINVFGMHIGFIILQVDNYGGTFGWVTNWTLPQVWVVTHTCASLLITHKGQTGFVTW
jgi:hypothetical protein